MYCRLVNNSAVDVVGSFENRFHPSLHGDFVECPDDIVAGWVYNADADTWSEPVVPEPEAEPEAELTEG